MIEALTVLGGGAALYLASFLASFLVGIVRGFLTAKEAAPQGIWEGVLRGLDASLEIFLVFLTAALMLSLGLNRNWPALLGCLAVERGISFMVDVRLAGEPLSVFWWRSLGALFLCGLLGLIFLAPA